MMTSVLERGIEARTVNLKIQNGNGTQIHSVQLNPSINYDFQNGIYVVKYGSIDFPDEQIKNDYNYGNKVLKPLSIAFSEHVAAIMHHLLERVSTKVIIRGVEDGNLEKTIEHHTDTWDREHRLVSYDKRDPRQSTYALPLQDCSLDSLKHVLELPLSAALEDRFSQSNMYNLVHVSFLHYSIFELKRNFEEEFDKALKKYQGMPMILVFDGSNAVPTDPLREGGCPYIFEGGPHLLAICYFEVNYPLSIMNIDRETFITALKEYRQWLDMRETQVLMYQDRAMYREIYEQKRRNLWDSIKPLEKREVK